MENFVNFLFSNLKLKGKVTIFRSFEIKNYIFVLVKIEICTLKHRYKTLAYSAHFTILLDFGCILNVNYPLIACLFPAFEAPLEENEDEMSTNSYFWEKFFSYLLYQEIQFNNFVTNSQKNLLSPSLTLFRSK